MRILVLLDDLTDPKIKQPVEGDVSLAPPSARRDLSQLLTRFDPRRVQVQTCLLRGTGSDEMPGLAARSRYDVAAWRRLATLIREQDIELIHAFGSGAALVASIAGRMTERPSLASIYAPSTENDANFLQQAIVWPQRQIMRRALDQVLVPSEHIRNELWRERYPLERINIIYPGVPMRDHPARDRAALGLPEGPLVTTVAELCPDEGSEVILDMVPRLLQRVPIAQIVVVGSGRVIQKMQHRAVQIRPALPIHWLSNRADVADIMAASDVIVSHTRSHQVISALCAVAAAGKPIVAARTGVATEIIEDKITGILSTLGDTRDMALQLGKLLLQPAYAQELGRNAERRARERYSLDAHMERITTLYESTVYATR
jgi:glycosyltransferase involved in cell wall biosynthesis